MRALGDAAAQGRNVKMTRRVWVAVDAVAGSWAARIYLVGVVIAFVFGVVAEVTTPPENGASFGFVYVVVLTLPWSILIPAVLAAARSSDIAPWSILVFSGLAPSSMRSSSHWCPAILAVRYSGRVLPWRR
jgi:hypothetical protein